MAFGGRKGSGLDLSGVGSRRVHVPGGGAGSHKGLSFANSGFTGGSAQRGGGSQQEPSGPNLGGSGKGDGINVRRLVTALVGVALALALAIGVGVVVYQQTVKSSYKPVLAEDQMTALVAPETQQTPYWAVLVATDAESGTEGRGNLTDAALIYIDPDNVSLSVLWVPSTLRVYLDGYGYHTIAEAFEIGHEATMINVCATLANIQVSDYFEVNHVGLSKLLDAEGIGSSAVDSTDSSELFTGLATKVLGSSSEQLSTEAANISTYVASNMGSEELLSSLQGLQGLDATKELHSADMPTTTDSTDEDATVVDTDSWLTMVERVASGMNPVATDKELIANENMRSSTQVSIWNGAGVTGTASDCSKHLEDLGWKIESTGNAASFVYDETLVVYNYDDDADLAQLLVSDLGQGRAVRSAARYSFEGDILVVVGKDYQPY